MIAISQYFKFHNENIRFGKSKNFEEALSKFEDGSDDWYLFQESFAQELFHANTKVYASKNQRHQITDWLINKNISINILKKAWPALKMKNGEMLTVPSKGDELFYWFSFISIMFFMILLVPLTLFGIVSISQGESIAVFFYPVLLSFLIFTTYKNIEPVIFLKKLNYRISNC
ncbi:hypothetical protein [Parendozoicomonas sp. Alg238-R29]|uniref:hypothetical protein n=1 Tax=Parendozoicomonas sp. Alg238-R29 TaxID=2993446 RepID=UPI00248D7363|nr:hypothetical protein [Parendozoicomonas sp. Alg238-R29]